MNIELVDNFLDENVFSEMKGGMTCPYFPWYWNSSTIDLKERYDEFKNIYYERLGISDNSIGLTRLEL